MFQKIDVTQNKIHSFSLNKVISIVILEQKKQQCVVCLKR